jgi:two-component sensor histidine kinase
MGTASSTCPTMVLGCQTALPCRTSSIGLKLVTVLAQQLQGTIQFINNEGTDAVISFPYPERGTTVQS